MPQPRARIASQLGIALAIVLALVITGSTLFALRSLDNANLATRQAINAACVAQGKLGADGVHDVLADEAGAVGEPVRETVGSRVEQDAGGLARLVGLPVGRDLQLVRDGISVMITVKGVTETVIYDHDKVVERYGLTPAQLVDYRALKGDSSDNIPNVPGVGEKTATALLQKYGTVENVMANVDNIDKPKIRESIREHLHQIPLARMLAEIRKDVPLGYDLPDVETLGTFVLQTEALVAYLERLEFRTLLKRVPGAKIASTPTLSSGASIVSDSQPGADYSAVPDGSEDDNSAAAAPRDVTITDDISILSTWAGKPVAVRVAAGPGASLQRHPLHRERVR